MTDFHILSFFLQGMTTSNTISRQKDNARLKRCSKITQHPLALEFCNNMEITNNENTAPETLPKHPRDLVFRLPFGVKHKPQYCFPARDRKKLVSCFVIIVWQLRQY